jgi:hypothetical protein
LITGVCTGVDIKRSDCCISCNTVLEKAEIGGKKQQLNAHIAK